MNSLTTPFVPIRFPWGFLVARGLFLGLILLLLAAGPAGAVSADEESLFNVAGYDPSHDEGTAVMPGGVRYEGGWREGKYHGWGGLTNPDGQGFEGKFQDGNLVCLKNVNG